MAAGWSLRSDLLRSGEQPGYTVVKGSLRTQHTAASFARSLFPGASAKALRKAGFVGAAEETLRGSHHRGGGSLVARFTNRRGAVELAKGLDEAIRDLARLDPHAKLNRFSMPGIGDSYGIIFRLGKLGLADLYWVEGDCTFSSGQVRPHGGRLTAKQLASAVITGAESQHARTNGTCPAVAATFTG